MSVSHRWRRMYEAPENMAGVVLESGVFWQKPILAAVTALGTYLATHVVQAGIAGIGVYLASGSGAAATTVSAGIVTARTGYTLHNSADSRHRAIVRNEADPQWRARLRAFEKEQELQLSPAQTIASTGESHAELYHVNS